MPTPQFAQHHTQSPRVSSFGGGATGGVDDRFDIMLTSSALTDNILVSTYAAYGNGGLHFNDSINRLPSNAVPDSIANALHAASDHLQVTAKFIFPRLVAPVQLSSLRASFNTSRDSVLIAWQTSGETNNDGFEVQRRPEINAEFETIPGSFIAGHGTTNEPQSYLFAHVTPHVGNWQYRLKQIDLDGSIHYSETVSIQLATSIASTGTPGEFTLAQNYPNPFNPTTTISFAVATTSHTSILAYDALGREVASLFNGVAEGGKQYAIQFDASSAGLSSGMYSYRLASHSTASTMKRMVLMK